jgi:zinc protease
MSRSNTKRPSCPRPRVLSGLLAVALLCSAAAPVTASTPPVERRVLSNGAVLLVSEQRALPMVIVRVLVDAGSRRDPQGKEGVANLTADLLNEGTTTRSAMEISEAVDFIGASLGSGAGEDNASVSLQVLRKDLGVGLDLLTDVLLQPNFPDAEIERRREAVLASMKAAEDNPQHVAGRTFRETFLRGEPYGHLVSGTRDSVSRLRRADIVSFYRSHYRPERSIVTVVGDVSADDMVQTLERRLRPWTRGAAPAFSYPAVRPGTPGVVTVQKPITQANIVLGHRGIARQDPDYYAVQVMNFILGGGGFTSRLLDTIRTKEGLAYSVGSSFSVNRDPGLFSISMQTKNESAKQALDLACAEVERIRNEEVTDEELSGAQLYLTGSFPMRLDSNGKIANFVSAVEFFGLGADYAGTYKRKIEAVTKADVQRVARERLHPEQLLLVVVANLEEAGIQRQLPCVATP